LHRAKTVKDLKVEIEIYEKVRGNAIHKKEKKVYQHNIQKQAKKVQNTSSRKCYKCRKEGHFAKQCVDEVICYKCHKTGHISKQCGETLQSSSGNKEATNVLEDISPKAGLIYKSFSAQNISFRAMVDSGSDLSLMREDVFRKFEGLKLTKEIKHLKGIGKGELITIGSFDLHVFVDNISFTITFHVVKRDELEYTAIVGNNILQKVDILFRTNGTRFIAKITEAEFAETFKAMCVTEMIEAQRVVDRIGLSHFDSLKKSEVEKLIRGYEPKQTIRSPVEMKTILEDDVPIF